MNTRNSDRATKCIPETQAVDILGRARDETAGMLQFGLSTRLYGEITKCNGRGEPPNWERRWGRWQTTMDTRSG